MKHFLISVAFAVSCALPATGATLTDTFTSFWVLGDSLSDNGNLKGTPFEPPPPYFDGRLSNGPVWNEGIAAEFATSDNLAVGGARTVGGLAPSLELQSLGFSAIPTSILGDRPLVSIWAGGNDLRDAVALGDAVTAANNIKTSIENLAKSGVADFLVFNLPNIGAGPSIVGTPLAGLATLLTTTFNDAMTANNAVLETSGLNIIPVDIFSALEGFRANPSAFGLTNVTDNCLANFAVCDANSWFFWDDLHPTAFAHSLIETQARQALAADISPIPLPATAILYLFAIAGIGVAARLRS